ncbi:MAG: DUF3443 family protein, partial [Candidatus Binataceae bacterium]
MKISIARAALVLVTCSVMIATSALAQTSAAHLAFSRKSIAFGMVKVATIRSLTIRNNGGLDANVTVSSPPSPFSVVEGGGSYSLAPGAEAAISVEFAPTAKGVATAELEVDCSGCEPANEFEIVHLRGNAEGPVVTPTPIAPTPTPSGPTPTPTGPTPTPTATPSPTMGNALPMSVNPGPYGTVDMPFVSLKICATGTANCTTVNNILVDTGSFGLRIYGSQISGLGIAPNTNQGSELGECAFFGSGSTWGAVSTVDVTVAGEPKITIPIQVMNDNDAFTSAPRDCTQGTELIASPEDAGFNGLFGIGAYSNDAIFTEYFDCSGSDCSLLDAAPNADIVPNPVAAFPVDNNGVVVSLPSISNSGEAITNGTLYFGIGTETDNQPGSVKTFQANSDTESENFLNINTVFGGATAGGFFDTGSNGYFFNDESIKECTDGSGFYCPTSTLSKSATNQSVGSSVSGVVDFNVADANKLFDTDDAAFNDLGGSYDGGTTYDGFDWGLPFFFGRSVYIGMAGTSSSLGDGPYT